MTATLQPPHRMNYVAVRNRRSQAPAALSTCTWRLAPSSDSHPFPRAYSTIPAKPSAQSGAPACGCAAALSASTSRRPVSASCSRPSPAPRSASSASSSVTCPRARCSLVRSSTATTLTSGISSAPPTTSTITITSSSIRELRSAGSLHVPGESGEVRIALLQERVPALDGLLGHVGQPRGLPGEQLLADQPVVDEVERVLEHPLGRRALGDDPAPPVQRGVLQFGV